MKFNAVVGNPPYQADDKGAGASSRPIYPAFVDLAKNLEASYVSLIIPARWYTGGKGGKEMDDFRKSMLEDVHIQELHDCLHPEEIFPETNNRGGVCYFLWNAVYDNSVAKTRVYTHGKGNKVTCVTRSLKTRGLNIFIRNLTAIEILDKVMTVSDGRMMSNHVSARKPFGIESNIVKRDEWHGKPDGMAEPLKCIGKGMRYGYVEKALVKLHEEWIPVWKVFTPRANNVGTELKDDNLNTLVGEPDTICTEAYLMLGTGLDLDEAGANHLARYFNTKFVRFMHSLAKASHDATGKTYRFVPVEDFREEWTDHKLYQKYKLTPEEIACIESSIKGM